MNKFVQPPRDRCAQNCRARQLGRADPGRPHLHREDQWAVPVSVERHAGRVQGRARSGESLKAGWCCMRAVPLYALQRPAPICSP